VIDSLQNICIIDLLGALPITLLILINKNIFGT
jgi:hypothetical protein